MPTVIHPNTIVLDLETRYSAQDCRWCGEHEEQHFPRTATQGPLCLTHRGQQRPTIFEPIGWDDHAALGLSIGCYYAYINQQYHWFDTHTLRSTLVWLVEAQPMIVSFNGRGFDGPLMLACLEDCRPRLIQDWAALWARSYDILHEIWEAAPEDKYARGLNSLGAISEAMGFGTKALDGATAPRLWQQGHYAEVINYCQADVDKTRRIFEHLCAHDEIVRGDGSTLRLPVPRWL